MTTSEEWEDIIQSFQPKTEEQKRKEVEAETKRLQLPLLDVVIRNVSYKDKTIPQPIENQK